MDYGNIYNIIINLYGWIRDGYIGTFNRVDPGNIPIYRFPGGESMADSFELNHGSNSREDLERLISKNDKSTKYAVISYWVGEYEPAKTWLYNSEKEASEAMNRLYKQSYDLAKEDENFEESECFNDETSAKIAWCDGLERWFEVSEVSTEEKI